MLAATVGQLIEELQQYDPKQLVLLDQPDAYYTFSVEQVTKRRVVRSEGVDSGSGMYLGSVGMYLPHTADDPPDRTPVEVVILGDELA